MEDLEKMEYVEKLRQKTGVSYEEAKKALEACEWDMLDAVIYLEKLGRVNNQSAQYSTADAEYADVEYEQKYREYENYQRQGRNDGSGIGGALRRFFEWCREMLRKGNDNFVCIEKGYRQSIDIPITIFVLLLVFAFWVVIIVMLIGLFAGYRYSIQGPDIHSNEVNNFMDKAADKATEIKEDFVNNGHDSNS